MFSIQELLKPVDGVVAGVSAHCLVVEIKCKIWNAGMRLCPCLRSGHRERAPKLRHGLGCFFRLSAVLGKAA